MNYDMPSKRKTKRDLKKKKQYGRYKKGGKYRTIKLDKKEDKKK